MKLPSLRVLTLAVAGIVTVPTAFGQFRVGDDGRALDANNRVGSGGRNDSGGPIRPQGLGNEIVTGNVTGGRQFRGDINYTDPTAFRGRVGGGGTDRFIRESAGVPDVVNPNFRLYQARPFYGDAETVAPPAGFVQQRWTGAYVPPPMQTQTGDDLRFPGEIDPSSFIQVPQSGELLMSGPIDQETNQQTMFVASPIYGVRPLRLNEEADRQFLENYTSLRQSDALDRVRLSPEDLLRMRDELGTRQRGLDEGQDADQSSQDPSRRQSQNSGQQQQPNAFGGAFSLTGSTVQSQQLQPQAATGDVATGQSTRNRVLVPPHQQSLQYAELVKRLDRQRELRGLPDNDVTRQNEFIEQARLREQEKAAKEKKESMEAQPPPGQELQAGPGGAGTGTGQPQLAPRAGNSAPGQMTIPDFGKEIQEALPTPTEKQEADVQKKQEEMLAPSDDPTKTEEPAAADKPDPLKIKSLAEGVSAKGLSEFLTSAEELMREQKYTSALDQYAMAEQVAPNNPLVQLGRANAELGAAYYVRAESDLREAFMADPALLMGQYDLREFLGDERIRFLVKDLKENANSEKSQARPVFLLAYIAYNTGNELQARGWLELAEQRAGADDPLFPLLREHWSLPEAPAEEDVNK